MKKLVLIVVLILMIGGAAAAQAQVPSGFSTPQNALTAFYNYISLQNYQSAYALWNTPPSSYNEFVNGYANTQYVLPYFGVLESSSATQAGKVISVLVSHQDDGSARAYYGCYDMIYNNGWRIQDGHFTRFAAYQPDFVTLNSILNQSCYNLQPVHTSPDQTSDAEVAVKQYYANINLRNYPDAYAMWLQPLPGPRPNGAPAVDYRPDANFFTAGYANTYYIDVYTGPYMQTGASAGHSYLNGFLPAVLIGQHTDNTFVTYYGCYVMGYLPDGSLGIVNGRFLQLENNASIWPSFSPYLNIDCTTLNIPG